MVSAKIYNWAIRDSSLGNATVKMSRVLYIIHLILFSLAFIKINYTNAQGSEIVRTKMDTLRVLNGRLKVLLKTSTFTVMKTDQLLLMYSSSFTGQILRADGFKIGENSTIRFYQTNIENSQSNDGGLSTWKLILSFTDQIPESQWIGSGVERMSNGFLYFVKLVSHERPEQFFKFVFFYIDNKLAFSLFQCPVYPLQAYPTEPEKYLSFVVNDPHPSRFTGFQKK
ncbi:MAG: hypothetical protein HY015_06470 [Bacteroidetes bacterium]|nr:hypothetical protein [Bacteroidota bacterium]MBI3482608.1 hypothetical protein [Bacteroidota bacterium]